MKEETDFIEFSKTFHEKLLLENCGISDVATVEKYSKKIMINRVSVFNGKDAGGGGATLDPINLVRNYYIFSELLNLDMDTSLHTLASLTCHSRYRHLGHFFGVLLSLCRIPPAWTC